MKQNTPIASEGVLIFNDQGNIVLTNPGANQLFGYGGNELLGMSVANLIPEAPTNTHQPLSLNQNGVSTLAQRLRGVKKDGVQFLVEISLCPFEGTHELFTVAFVSESDHQSTLAEKIDKNQTRDLIDSLANVEKINRDLQLQINKRKAIEQELIKFQRLYDTMVHNFPDGVIGVLNKEMKYVLIDGKDLNEIDLPALGLTGLKVSETQDPEAAEQTLLNIKKAFSGQSVSFEVKTKDRFYNIAAVPLPDAKNEINEILCVLKNVTDRKRMEDGLLKALEKEKELGELKSRFVTMASHEFKTPLATILSSTFLLENYSGEDFEKEKKVHTNRIKRSVRNLTMILNEFLSLEKLEENQVRVTNTEINLPNYIREIISEFEQVKQPGQVICYQHLGDQETACLDPLLLWSIITNLISNALKYSKPGDSIYLNSEIRNNAITFKVKDFGIGIPADEHRHIFGRFYRARNAMNFEGTGLGLHIVEKNVKLFGGNVSFTSQPNDGTEFTVTLPNGSLELTPVYN